jgi:hypothetical protein
MKKIIAFLLVLCACSALFAQERIAVFPFEDMDNILTRSESIFFYRQFSNEFTNRNSGRFIIVPRQEVEKLINTEAAFQLSDFSAKAKTAEMERVLNGTQILSGVIGKVGNRITISISLYTYPELSQLPGGVDLRVTNKDELFDKIPELVQSMQKAIEDRNTDAGGKTGIAFTGSTITERTRQTITYGLRNALLARKMPLDIDEKANAKNGYGFGITVYLEQLVGYSLIKAEAAVTFSRDGQVLCQSARYDITETNETELARRIADRLRADRDFFNKVNDAIK